MLNGHSRFRTRFEVSKHTNLPTQQRRLRHLTCIIGRNIDAKLVPVTRQNKYSLLSLYFTLHASDNQNKAVKTANIFDLQPAVKTDLILYKSEVIENTLNPNWRDFDPEVFLKDSSKKKDSSVLLCIWGSCKNNDFKIILNYHVNFSGLQYFTEQLRSQDHRYETNCILFRLFGGFYCAPKDDCAIENEVKNQFVKVHIDQLMPSYKKASLLRIHSSLKAIHQAKLQVEKVQYQMVQLLASSKEKTRKNTEKETIILRNKLMREELKVLKQKILYERSASSEQNGWLCSRENELKKRLKELSLSQEAMGVSHTFHIQRRELLVQVTAQINYRIRQLAADLINIYTIRELPINEKNKREYTICGVRLPNSEDFNGEDETMLAVAVGYVAHLVYMMAKFTELPLRYPICPMGSRSSVQDLVTDKLTDKEREFPLFSKGKEKFHFRYGMFLLNKNIAQLRYHNKLGTTDLRNTLLNLKNLFEAKFGLRFDLNNSLDARSGQNQFALGNPSHRHSLPFGAINSEPVSFQSSSSLNKENYFSGLPNVHVKAHHQHRFIARKNVKPKIHKSLSLPNGLTSTSPDLIQTPFEDILRQSREISDVKQIHSSMTAISEIKVHEQLDSHEDIVVKLDAQEIKRQLSDALIIPDPFEDHHLDFEERHLENILV
ncbi:UV radiation resistance-associated protein isoform X1 [Hydra vulgaris]|uniref:UV radiation resistance-associated protein isoform X1 n=1 Tax=Hydra vulgaris TaxID=6087 RepID=UPI001F5F18CD|nr:UV radiation resistance-associated protein isoform X1 [Hydra vulgaris]